MHNIIGTKLYTYILILNCHIPYRMAFEKFDFVYANLIKAKLNHGNIIGASYRHRKNMKLVTTCFIFYCCASTISFLKLYNYCM